jgi:hypothetical protein
MTTQIIELMLISTRKFVRRYHGDAGWQSVLERMAERHRAAFDRELVPSRRFDFALGADLLRAVAEAFGKDDGGDEVMHRLGMHNAEEDLNATEKLLMRILTIKLVLKIASFLWTARVRQGGSMVVTDRGRKGAGCRIERPPDVSPHWWRYLAGWFHRTIELAGGRSVRARWTGGGGAPGETATFEVDWD